MQKDIYQSLVTLDQTRVSRETTFCNDVGEGLVRIVSPGNGMLLVVEQYQLHKDFSVSVDNSYSKHLGLSYCLSGQITCSSDQGGTFVTESGHSEFLLTQRPGRWRSDYAAKEPISILNIMLNPSLLHSTWGDLQPVLNAQNGATLQTGTFHHKRHTPATELPAVQQLLQAECHGLADALKIQSRVLDLIAEHLYHIAPQLDEPPSPSPHARYQQAVDQACEILRMRHHSPPTLAELSRMVGINDTKLKRGFRQFHQTTAYQYLTQCRMERACKLLTETPLSLSEIAWKVGYAERTQLSRAFSRHFGFSPSHYREMQAGGSDQSL